MGSHLIGYNTEGIQKDSVFFLPSTLSVLSHCNFLAVLPLYHQEHFYLSESCKNL